MKFVKTMPIIAMILLFFACRGTGSDREYVTQVKEWQKRRLASLKEKDSWLSLAGLFWLEQGENSFGSAPANKLVIDDVRAPAIIGTFILDAGQVRFQAAAGVKVVHKEEAIADIKLDSDEKGKPTILRHGSLSWFVIKRGERLGVRLKDAAHPRIKQLRKIDTFPVDPGWRIAAVMERFEKPRIIKTPTVLGTIVEQPTPGKLLFKVNGRDCSLVPVGGGGDLFVVFGDRTNGHETYGGGRFLVVKKPDQQGRTLIDFNRAYNPPCVFSAYATCPLPAAENILPVRIAAGEKMVAGLGH